MQKNLHRFFAFYGRKININALSVIANATTAEKLVFQQSVPTLRNTECPKYKNRGTCPPGFMDLIMIRIV